MGKLQEPKVTWKDNRDFRHDLFRLDVQEAARNSSFVKGDPIISLKKHNHFFHSHNSKGKPFELCAPQVGHFHKIETSTDAKGNLTAKCGPPLRNVIKKRGRRQVREVEAVQYESHEAPTGFITDSHVHKCTYMHSESLSEARMQQKQQQDASKLAAMKGAFGRSSNPAVPVKPDALPQEHPVVNDRGAEKPQIEES